MSHSCSLVHFYTKFQYRRLSLVKRAVTKNEKKVNDNEPPQSGGECTHLHDQGERTIIP